jgi:adenosylcobinamide kinase / adenosylcobinamide-phosphate guanylyltransferase
LATAIQTANPSHCLLIDSLGTWVANLVEQDDSSWDRAEQALLQQLALFTGEVIAVAEEVGWGVVPAYPVGRLFRDRLGALVRKLGAIAHSTYLVTGGHVLNLSELGHSLCSAMSKSC